MLLYHSASRRVETAVLLTLTLAAPLCSWEPPDPRTTRKSFQKNLSHQKLAGQKFQGANLRNTEMSMTDLRGADLRGADFTNSEMDRTDLDDADLSGAVGLGTADFGMGVNAQRANFQRADLQNARLTRVFDGADFRGANLRGAFLHGRFHGARFDGADVRDAVLLGAYGIEPVRADLRSRGAIVTSDDLLRSIRAGRDYSSRELPNVELVNANLDGVTLRKTTFRAANLTGASLRRIRASESWLLSAKLDRTDLSEADLTGARLGGATLTEADLSNAICRGASFFGADLRGAKLTGTDLRGVDFREADLTGADLSGATLDDFRWEAAIIADLRGITADEQDTLKSKAGRWKHNLARGFNQFVRDGSIPLWLSAWPSGLLVLCAGRRLAPRHPSIRLLFVLQVLAALPALAFLFLIIAGASPTVQLSGNMGGWSAWVKLWPTVYNLGYVGLIGWIPVMVVVWFTRWRWPVPGLSKYLVGASILTGLTLAASLAVLGILAPRA